MTIRLWVDTRGVAPSWVGWCRRCGTVCVFGDWRGHAVVSYYGNGDRTIDMKPCPLTREVYVDRRDNREGIRDRLACGGDILELPNQIELLACYMLGGAEAMEPFVSIAHARPPVRLWGAT